MDLAFTNSSPFTPIHSGLYAYTALLINPAHSFTVFNPYSLCQEMQTFPLLLTCFFFFLTLAGVKEEAGSPVDSKQEVFGVW